MYTCTVPCWCVGGCEEGVCDGVETGVEGGGREDTCKVQAQNHVHVQPIVHV